MDTACDLAFGDGSYRFWLPMPQIIELERKCETSVLSLYEQFESSLGVDQDGGYHYIGGGGPSVVAVRETIRLALIGGNRSLVDGDEAEVGPLRARELVELYVYPARPLAEGAALAGHILMAAVRGVSLKKKDATSEGPDAIPPS